MIKKKGKKDKRQPLELALTDLDLDIGEDTDEGDDSSLVYYLPEKCWVKRIKTKDDGYESYYLIAITLDDSERVEKVSVVLERITRMGGGWFIIPGMELSGSAYHEKLFNLPEKVVDELHALMNGRYIRNGFSFMGKMLPNKIITECRNGLDDTNYTFAMQSAYRLAYTHMSIDTDKKGIITDFEYSSYQSNGSACGDMFSRPIGVRDRKEEALDMLLYIVESYSDEEYQTIVS